MSCIPDAHGCDLEHGPIPTWMIIVITSCGFVGLICVALYTNYITSGRHYEAPVQERYSTAEDVTSTLIKEKSKHVIELLLRGGNLATLPTTGLSLNTSMSTNQGDSALPMDAESHI